MTQESLAESALRARSFGGAAESYERIRPSYPPALFDDVLAYAQPPVERVLEVGAGTGKATSALVAHGLLVDAVRRCAGADLEP